MTAKGDENAARPYHVRMKRLLLTGFGPFPGAPENPTAQMVQNLASCSLGSMELVTRILPVIWNDAEARIAALIDEVKPDVILHLGLATKRSTIGVETRARNECTRLHPDADNICRASGTIDPHGPGLRHARVDTLQLVEVLCGLGLDAELSDDAGDYICNHTLYLSLGSHVPRVGFIHLPTPNEQMTLTAMQNGIEKVLRVMAQEA
jgi:pyroglutamyl-peptidase